MKNDRLEAGLKTSQLQGGGQASKAKSSNLRIWDASASTKIVHRQQGSVLL